MIGITSLIQIHFLERSAGLPPQKWNCIYRVVLISHYTSELTSNPPDKWNCQVIFNSSLSMDQKLSWFWMYLIKQRKMCSPFLLSPNFQLPFVNFIFIQSKGKKLLISSHKQTQPSYVRPQNFTIYRSCPTISFNVY